MKWDVITGIILKHDLVLLQKSGSVRKASKVDEKLLHQLIIDMKAKKGKDRMTNSEIQQSLAMKQDNNEINWKVPIASIKPTSFPVLIARLRSKYDKSDA